MIDQKLIVNHFFSFLSVFIIASTGITYNFCFILCQQKTCSICGFTDEEGRQQYQAKRFEQNVKSKRDIKSKIGNG